MSPPEFINYVGFAGGLPFVSQVAERKVLTSFGTNVCCLLTVD